MKNTMLTLMILLLTGVGYAQNVKSEISAVTVYQQGAQITRKATLSLKSGINSVEIGQLSRFIDASSFQVKIGGAKIISLNYTLDYVNNEEQHTTRKNLQSKIEQLEYRLKELNNERMSAEQELKLIEQNVQIKGQAVLDVADMEDFLLFYRRNLPVIRGNLLVLEKEAAHIQKELQETKAAFQSLHGRNQIVNGILELEVSTAKASTQQLEIKYFVSNARWEPYYNVRASSISEPLAIEFNANVYQTTGEEWEGIALTLATGTPQLNGTAPTLYPWNIDYYVPRPRKKFRANYRSEEQELSVSDAPMANKAMIMENNGNLEIEQLTFQEYRIAAPYNVSSDGKGQRVEIKAFAAPASYQYQAIPKLNPDVFLMAKVPNWESYNLISGSSKIYFEDTYVGEAYIDARSTDDTLSLSLGQDRNIQVERNIKVDQSGTKFIGFKQTKNRKVEIKIRNNKKSAITLSLLDQLPVARREEIKVELKEGSGAQYNSETGEIKWEIELEPGQNATKIIMFEVTYPKGKVINL